MAARNIQIVVLGSLNTDYVVRSEHLPKPGESVRGGPIHIGSGGKGANQAVAAARLGARVALIGQVGDEPRGREMVRQLRREKIDTSRVSFDAKVPTGAAIIAVDRNGEKQISAALGANDTLRVRHVRAARDLIASARVLLMQLEVPMPCILEAARIAAFHGVKVILDPAPPVELSDELFSLLYAVRPNAHEASVITGQTVRDVASARAAGRILLRKGVQLVALEAGAAGDLVMSGTEEFILPRLKVKSVDTTGAGDAFAAGLAVGTAEGLPLPEVAHLANVTAGLSTKRMGAQDGLPSRAVVERWIRKANSR